MSIKKNTLFKIQLNFVNKIIFEYFNYVFFYCGFIREWVVLGLFLLPKKKGWQGYVQYVVVIGYCVIVLKVIHIIVLIGKLYGFLIN